jgi:Transposase DDE domain group 1
MRKSTGSYPSLSVDTSGKRVVSQAGAVLLSATVVRAGLDRELSAALRPWMRPMAVHDPGKVLLDLAVAVAIGGDCLADIAVVRSEPAVFGQVASDPTVSRLIDTLASDAPAALAAINTARARVRARVWSLAGSDAPDHQVTVKTPLIIDLDATLITAHSEKELAAPTFKRGFGHHPIGAWVDHGAGGTGEPVAMLLRKGNAGSNTAVDHIEVTRAALRQLPSTEPGRRPGRKVLIRTDGAGGTHDFVAWLAGQRLQYSVGFSLNEASVSRLELVPESAWTPAYDADGAPRDGAWVTELTGLLDLSDWPAGMRVIVRAERPHPGAQLRFTDVNGNRLTAFATNTKGGQLPDLELRHRRRARCEDRIRNAKDTGLKNLPLHDFSQNQIWIAVVMLATELTAWMQMLALSKTSARVWEPKRLRLRLFSIAARIVRRSRRNWLQLSAKAAFGHLITTGLARLTTHPEPA